MLSLHIFFYCANRLIKNVTSIIIILFLSLYIVECLFGFFGINCSKKCNPPYYGIGCYEKCENCASCHHIHGCIQEIVGKYNTTAMTCHHTVSSSISSTTHTLSQHSNEILLALEFHSILLNFHSSKHTIAQQTT